MKGISAVIATYQRRNQLKALLSSIVDNSIEHFEAIIADQNTDGLIYDIIEEYRKKLDITHLKIAEANQSKARNIGAEAAKYPILCFPDDDCWYEPDTLRKVIAHFDDPATNTDLLIINWRQHPIKPAESTTIRRSDLFSFRSAGYATITLYFKTSVFRQLGGFLETIGIGRYIGGGEDSELTFRAMSRNCRLYYRKEIGVNHLYNPIVTRDLSVIRTRQRAMGYLYVRYHVPYWVVLRGIVAPMVKMLCALSGVKRKQFYNMCCARVEGLVYGLKEKDNRLSKRIASLQYIRHNQKADAGLLGLQFLLRPDSEFSFLSGLF
ncbi:MAG: glycosyltransferase [Chitinophagaceae bacterium]|nr:MAG: glycosyltransferase [Chitinophagaceae bacterium]